MAKGLEAAREQITGAERLAQKVPGLGGYLERGLLREVDRMQREHVAQILDGARRVLNEKIVGWARQGALAGLDVAANCEKRLDRLASRVRHADHGASGIFDAVKIGTTELERIYSFDIAFLERGEALVRRVDETTNIEDLCTLATELDRADRAFDARASVYENVTVKGA